LRAQAIGSLITECGRVFKERLVDIEQGTFDRPLVGETPCACAYDDLKNFERKRVYRDSRVLQIEYAGYSAIGGLLDIFCEATLADKPSGQQRKLLDLLPQELFDRPDTKPGDRLALTPYQRILAVTDYVSGMTDSFAVSTFQRLSGIQLPS
jgi:dGTPase